MSWAEPTPDYYSRRILILQALFPLDLKNILVLANKQSGKKRKRQMGIHTGGFPELHNKLVLERERCKTTCHCEPVRLSGVAIPRLDGECTDKHPKTRVPAIFGGNRFLVPFNRGIATTCVRTGLAMTALFFKHQLSVQL